MITSRRVTIAVAAVALLAATAALPIPVRWRGAVLAAVVVGFVAARLFDPRADSGLRHLVGPAVFMGILVPPADPWPALAWIPLLVVGVGSAPDATLSRAAMALGPILAAAVVRSGEPLVPSLIVCWLVTVAVLVALEERPEPLQLPPAKRLLAVGAFVIAVGPLSFIGAEWLAGAIPPLASRPTTGDLTGPRLRTHPGLTGGLDAGQPVDLSDEVVLRVAADRPMFWRGTTYERWDGRRWSGEASRFSTTWREGARIDVGALIDEPARPVPATTTSVEQRFTAEQAGLDVLLAAWRMETMWTSGAAGAVGEDGSFVLDEPLGAGASWTVESNIRLATGDDLRRADPERLDARSEVMSRYGSEADVTPEVAELARSVTADAETTYDKVLALEGWMDDNIVYTRDIGVLEPGDDAVHHLLFESRRGYCEQIGSALVVMLRSLAIPARLVVGYVPGEQDPNTGEWLSRGTDAHAWAEVYFPGVGWQGFDPTAGVPVASSSPAVTVERWVLAAAGLAGAGFVLVVSRLRRHRPHDDLADLHRRLDRKGQELGLDWDPATTVREKAEDLLSSGAPPETVDRIASAIEHLTYDPRPISTDPGLVSTAQLGLEALEEEAPAAHL